MAVVITPYCGHHAEAVKAFNERLRAAGATLFFPETNVSDASPKYNGRAIHDEHFLAVDDGAVRGAYILKRQPFYAAGEDVELAQYRLPLSEGYVDKRFAALGVQLYLDALRKQPRLYTIGLGGYDEAITQMLIKAGWQTWSVPFYFRVLRPAPFLRNIVYLRSTPARRWALDALALSGLGTLGLHTYQVLKTRRVVRKPAHVEYNEESTFGAWADEIWNAAKSDFTLIAVRDAAVLNTIYPTDEPRWMRLKVSHAGKIVGWAVVLNVPMEGHNYFGDMRVGSLIDCLAVPGMESNVTSAAVEYLRRHDADIVVTNMSHSRWRAAAETAGLYEGPSNYIFAASKGVSELLDPFNRKKHRIHMTRGDGVGAQNLIAARK